MRTLRAAGTYFGIVFGTGFVLGAIRVPFLVPRLGVRAAELIEMPFMLAVIVLAARHVVRRFALTPRERLATGALALALLVAAELGLAAVVTGQSVRAYVASRDPVSGGVYLALLLMFGLLPRFFAPAPAFPSAARSASRGPAAGPPGRA